ncbi:MAG TPA: GNAT family N-acetyltransferase [Candidatus Dormibacteraeota bacterium]|nr:GNAT family N-acetyltransferase [Candidatus Dormibacteraeota bacterium]
MVEIEAGCEGRPGLASLDPSDGPLVSGMFRRLSPESVYRRFFSPISRSDAFQASVLRVDHRDHEAIAAVQGGEIVGLAQYARLPGAKQANLAIVVADAWQRQGLGTRLIAALADRAVEEGIDSFAVDIQGDNFGALKLLRRVSPRTRMVFSAGVGEGTIELT